MKKFTFDLEMADGTIHKGARIFAADRLKAVKIARTNEIPWEDGPEAHALLIFAAVRRLGLTTADNFDDWMNEVVDFALGATDDEDPTTPTA